MDSRQPISLLNCALLNSDVGEHFHVLQICQMSVGDAHDYVKVTDSFKRNALKLERYIGQCLLKLMGHRTFFQP